MFDALSGEDSVRNCELGVNSYFVKPVDCDTCVEVVAGFAMCALLVNRGLSEEGRMP